MLIHPPPYKGTNLDSWNWKIGVSHKLLWTFFLCTINHVIVMG